MAFFFVPRTFGKYSYFPYPTSTLPNSIVSHSLFLGIFILQGTSLMASVSAYPPLHTAEHLITRLLYSRFPTLTDFTTRLKSRKCVVEFSYEAQITEADRAALEAQLKEIAASDLPITIDFIPRKVAAATMPNLHQVPADADPVRIVRVGAGNTLVDERCCIGTHVQSTEEIHEPRLPTLRQEEGKWRITLVVSD
jgi:Ser-tRNA(Ala) deacylase AlaX